MTSQQREVGVPGGTGRGAPWEPGPGVIWGRVGTGGGCWRIIGGGGGR
jgi:hypothetical protein